MEEFTPLIFQFNLNVHDSSRWPKWGSAMNALLVWCQQYFLKFYQSKHIQSFINGIAFHLFNLDRYTWQYTQGKWKSLFAGVKMKYACVYHITDRHIVNSWLAIWDDLMADWRIRHELLYRFGFIFTLCAMIKNAALYLTMHRYIATASSPVQWQYIACVYKLQCHAKMRSSVSISTE